MPNSALPTKPMSTLPDAADTYLCYLMEELDKARRELEKAQAEYNAKQTKYTRTLAWEVQLSKYCTALLQTNLLAENLKTQLENAINQAKIVGDSACFAVDALRFMLHDVETLAKCVEAFQLYVEAFIKDLPAQLDPKDPVKAAYQKLLDALTEALKCVTDALAALLLTLEKAEMLWKGVADPGLSKHLSIIADTFCKAGARPDYDPCPSDCGSSKPVFPLDDNNNADYTGTMTECDDAADAVEGLRDDLKAAEEALNEKRTCYDALKASYEAASAANACKTK